MKRLKKGAMDDALFKIAAVVVVVGLIVLFISNIAKPSQSILNTSKNNLQQMNESIKN